MQALSVEPDFAEVNTIARFRTVSTTGIALSVTWREPDTQSATSAALAAMPTTRISPRIRLGTTAVAVGFLTVCGVAGSASLAHRYIRHRGKRYARLPMSGVELESCMQ